MVSTKQTTPTLSRPAGLEQRVDKDIVAAGAAAKQTFVGAAVSMTWQLAVVVLVPIIGGVELDNALGTSRVYTLCGLGLALVGSIVVMWRTMQVANRLPVPKLTAAQKRAIKESYEAEDD